MGKGIEFNGTNHVVIPASKTVNDFLDGFTYLLWVKPLGNPSGPHVRLIERDCTIQISQVCRPIFMAVSYSTAA